MVVRMFLQMLTQMLGRSVVRMVSQMLTQMPVRMLAWGSVGVRAGLALLSTRKKKQIVIGHTGENERDWEYERE